MNDFNTKLVMEMMKQLLQQNETMAIPQQNSVFQPQQTPQQYFLIPNQITSFPQLSNNISNNYCIQTASMPTQQQTCTTTTTSNNITNNIQHISNYSNNVSNNHSTTMNDQTILEGKSATNNNSTNISNSNFEQMIPLLLKHCIESNIFPNSNCTNTNLELANNQGMISQLVELIDKIIYLNSVNSNLRQSTVKHESHDSNNQTETELNPVKEEFSTTALSTKVGLQQVKEEYHSDSSHSSLLSNTIVESNTDEGKKKRKRKEETLKSELSLSIQHDQQNLQKRKIQKQNSPQHHHSDIHSNILVTPLKTNNSNGKELLLNQFCNYTVDTLKQKLTTTEKRGRGRPKKQDETSHAQNQSSTSSFYTKSAFHHVHFNKQ